MARPASNSSKEINLEDNENVEFSPTSGATSNLVEAHPTVSNAEITLSAKADLVRVKFLEAHTMTIAFETYTYKAGDVAKVEMATANRLVSRRIAHIV